MLVSNSTATKAIERETIHKEGIWIEESQNEIAALPLPTKKFIGITNPFKFQYKQGQLITVQTLASIPEARKIKRVSANIIEFDSELNHSPILGGFVFVVAGEQETEGIKQ